LNRGNQNRQGKKQIIHSAVYVWFPDFAKTTSPNILLNSEEILLDCLILRREDSELMQIKKFSWDIAGMGCFFKKAN
jgi:hypothetical protein